MAELNGNLEPSQADKALSPDERRIFSTVFTAVDSEGLGVVTGDVAIKFLPEKTRLPSEILGEIWQVADPEDKGFVTKAGFFVILRLIGYAQAGRGISADLAARPGPLPRLEGTQMVPGVAPLQAQGSGGPIPIPRLSPEKASQYAQLFEQSGAQDGVLDGAVAKSIFDRAQLPNDVLIRIWNLADTEQRGKLSITEFIIAMHLLASFRSGQMRALPNNLPAGLYEAAARRGIPARSPPGSRTDLPPVSAIPRTFTGQSATARTSSPLARQQYSASPAPMQPQTAGLDWAIPPNEKAIYDGQFARLDTNKTGSIGGEQAVGFFSNSRLSENDLAQIWDLADVTQSGSLSQDEFVVAMHLIRQQLNSRGPLPTTLPTNLIPPSLRKGVLAPTAQPLPVQAQVPASPPRTKSAMDDLFGLEVASAPNQVPQSTGGSAAVSPAAAFKSTSPPPSASHFKPFVPSSAFGQSIAPQATGQSTPVVAPTQRQLSADDDLLGDADPEESKKFTQDTTDVANLTNQVNTLNTQTRELQTKKAANQQEVTQSSIQKQEIEARLVQLRSAYEQEARELKALQDRLNNSKTETTKLQQDFVMVQHSFQILQEQKQQAQTGLEADQKENASLKERIAEVHRETNQIKPQIEKMKADARQQKGLVAINKKQLSTAEAEREKAKAELEAATNEHHEATRELEESHQALEASKALDASRAVSPPVNAVSAASPAPSAASMNPFFRQTQTALPQGGFSPPVASPNHSAFDSFFADSSFPAPPTENPTATRELVQETTDLSTSGISDPVHRGTEPFTQEGDLPSASHQPPPPPRSRQMTPSVLPLRDETPRAPSADSSLGVVPPASQFDDISERNTPTKERGSPLGESLSGQSPLNQSQTAEATHTSPAPEILSPEPLKSAHMPVPGGFPVDSPVATPALPITDETRDIPAAEPTTNGNSTQRSTFDALFGGFSSSSNDTKGKAPVSDSAFGGPSQAQKSEFPPIEELGNDDEDSSDDESEPSNTFGDRFEAQAPSAHQAEPVKDTATSLKPAEDSGPSTALPTPNAQQSPPSYMQTISPQTTEPRDANQFAAEYTGLLPPREDPRALSHSHSGSNGTAEEAPIQLTSVTAVDHPPPISHSQPADSTSLATSKPTIQHDDFDDAFGDLSEAQAADHTTDDDFASARHEAFDDFNPTFDSPAPSKAPTLDNSAFNDFESTFSAPTQSVTASSIPGTTARPGPSKDEWDAMFAGFETEATQSNGITAPLPANVGKADGFLDAFDVPANASNTAQRPDIARAPSHDNEHDDPILKHLTAMGYARGTAVEALEKFDYNLDKAANYLASQS